MYLSVIETTSHQYNALLVSGTGLDGISQSILLYRWHLRAHNHHRHEHTWVHDYSCLLPPSCFKWRFRLTGLELILSQFQPKWIYLWTKQSFRTKHKQISQRNCFFIQANIQVYLWHSFSTSPSLINTT